MTGHYCNSTGVWHTIGGRSLMHPDEWTLPQALEESGYKNGTCGGVTVDQQGFVRTGFNNGLRGMKNWEYDVATVCRSSIGFGSRAKNQAVALFWSWFV